jgi:hypothetical protein
MQLTLMLIYLWLAWPRLGDRVVDLLNVISRSIERLPQRRSRYAEKLAEAQP